MTQNTPPPPRPNNATRKHNMSPTKPNPRKQAKTKHPNAKTLIRSDFGSTSTKSCGAGCTHNHTTSTNPSPNERDSDADEDDGPPNLTESSEDERPQRERAQTSGSEESSDDDDGNDENTSDEDDDFHDLSNKRRASLERHPSSMKIVCYMTSASSSTTVKANLA